MNTSTVIQDKRSLRRASHKLARMDSHVGFIERCITEDIIPKGYKVKWTSYIFHHVVVNVTTVFVTSYEEAV